MAIKEDEEESRNSPQGLSVQESDDAELPAILPYIQNLQEKISKMTEVITQKQQLLTETASKLEASNALNDTINNFECEMGEYINYLLDKSHITDDVAAPDEPGSSLVQFMENDKKENQTQLLLAVKNGNLEKIQELGNEDVDKTWSDALFLAFQNGHTEIVDHIIPTHQAKLTINLQEYCHYFSQLKDKILINKCRAALKAVINAELPDN
ncbi:unnamed protein product [Bursaphelenchus okinawaensis]|uniref:ANK_REP_REGION domain-containing protein n=1 Tax=Bursaphelenchus okinawaensis TaxID=465554 RepID=A0A811KWU1_9BILA|nr:unnamed protein product [Bursaphelenchus okinawaensis]CAG9112457.1 unnamed protein product [Bursaphelenchus okinawaensis]